MLSVFLRIVVYCGVCGETFKRVSRLVMHNRVVHKDVMTVRMCEQSYVTPRRIKTDHVEYISEDEDDYRSQSLCLHYSFNL